MHIHIVTLLSRLALPLVIFSAAAAAAAQEDLLRLLPADTMLAIEIKDVPGLLQVWNGSPFIQFYADPRAAAFVRPLRDRIEAFQRRMATDPQRLWGFFNGPIVVAGIPSSKGLEWVVLARHNGDAQVLERLRRPPAPAGATLRRIPDKLDGYEITRFEIIRAEAAEIPEPQALADQRKSRRPTLTAADLAQAQGGAPPVAIKRQVAREYDLYLGPALLVYAGSRGRPLQRILRRLANTPTDTLAGEAPYQRIGAALGPGAQIAIYSRAGALAATALGSIGKLSGLVNIGALGFEGIQAAGAAIRLLPGRIETDVVVLAPEPRQGISRVLFLPEGKAPDLPGLAPLDAVAYADASIPLDKIWGAVMQTLQTASPAVYMLLEGQFRTFEQVTGVGVQTALAARLGDRVIRFILPTVQATGGSMKEPAVTMLGLKDGAAFRDALRALLEYTLPFVGYHLEIDRGPRWPIWTLGEGAPGTPGAAAGRPLYYLSITDQWLIAAPRRDSIELVLQRIEHPQEGASLSGQAIYRRVSAQLSPQRFATMIMDTGGLYKLSQSVLGATPAAGSLEARARDMSVQIGDVLGLRMSAMPDGRVWDDYFGAAGAALICEKNEILRMQIFFEYRPK